MHTGHAAHATCHVQGQGAASPTMEPCSLIQMTAQMTSPSLVCACATTASASVTLSARPGHLVRRARRPCARRRRAPSRMSALRFPRAARATSSLARAPRQNSGSPCAARSLTRSKQCLHSKWQLNGCVCCADEWRRARTRRLHSRRSALVSVRAAGRRSRASLHRRRQRVGRNDPSHACWGVRAVRCA